METDSFIEEFKKNDYSRFDEFYKLVSKRIYFTALGILKNKEAAEDIVQETLMSFLENIDGYKMDSNLFSYLTVIARNKSINVYNKDKRIVFDDERISNISYEMDVKDAGVEEILGLLADTTDREIVAYHVLNGYKFKEIAEIINMPLGTVLWRYNRAMKNLAKGVKL